MLILNNYSKSQSLIKYNDDYDDLLSFAESWGRAISIKDITEYIDRVNKFRGLL